MALLLFSLNIDTMRCIVVNVVVDDDVFFFFSLSLFRSVAVLIIWPSSFLSFSAEKNTYCSQVL